LSITVHLKTVKQLYLVNIRALKSKLSSFILSISVHLKTVKQLYLVNIRALKNR